MTLHVGQRPGADQAARVVIERTAQRDEVRFAQRMELWCQYLERKGYRVQGRAVNVSAPFSACACNTELFSATPIPAPSGRRQ